MVYLPIFHWFALKIFRPLTKKEKTIEGLTTGRDAPLEVLEAGVAGRGVFAKAFIAKGEWLCEYKTHAIYTTRKAKDEAEEEYTRNQEGCYIVETAYPLPGQGRIFFDATRKFHQFGRYLNHALSPNATLMPPVYIRGKWRVGFLSLTDISEGDEVVWDYQVRDTTWSKARLVEGVVKAAEAAGVTEEKSEETKDVDHEEESKVAKGKSPAASRRLCFCPLGCSRPVLKLSNHLSQVHHLSPKERAQYLGLKRKFARPEDLKGKRRIADATIRRSRRLESFFKSSEPGKEPNQPSPRESSPDLETPDLEESTHVRDPSPDPTKTEAGEYIHQSESEGEEIRAGESSPQPGSSGLCKPTSPSPSNYPGETGKTRNLPRHSIQEDCLQLFAEHLQSRTGGKKGETQAREIVTDLAKFLYFVDKDQCKPESVLSARNIRHWVEVLESHNVGPSGVLTKLRRLRMFVDWVELESEDTKNEADIISRAAKVRSAITALSNPYRREKSSKQARRMEEFAEGVPDLGNVTEFLKSHRVDAFFDNVLQNKEEATNDQLRTAMLLVAGRLMMR